MQGKVNSNMANSIIHAGVGARIARVGAVVLGVAAGGSMLLNVAAPNGAVAQGKKAAASSSDSSWVKLCDKRELKGKDKAGKEATKDVEMCMTLTEQIHPDTGMTMVGAMLQNVKIDGKEQNTLSVTVLPGVSLRHGAAVTVFPKDVWEKVQKNQKLEKSDEEKLKSNTVKLAYGYCLQAGCHAETEATPDVIKLLKSGAGFMVHTVRMPGTPVSQPVPLGGFAKVLAGPPTDTKKFKAARTALMKQIAERQKQMLAELKKQQEDLNKMQPNVKAGAKK